MKHTGGALSPFNAWVLLKGMETLELRCNAQADTALTLAEYLHGPEKLERLIYPFLPDHAQEHVARQQMTKGGTVLTIDVAGGKAGAFRFLNQLKIARISNNLGDAKSLVTHPATTTHQRLTPEQRAALGITDGMIRFSVGLEDCQDLRKDIMGALAVV